MSTTLTIASRSSPLHSPERPVDVEIGDGAVAEAPIGVLERRMRPPESDRVVEIVFVRSPESFLVSPIDLFRSPESFLVSPIDLFCSSESFLVSPIDLFRSSESLVGSIVRSERRPAGAGRLATRSVARSSWERQAHLSESCYEDVSRRLAGASCDGLSGGLASADSR